MIGAAPAMTAPRPNHAFAVAISDLRERAQKLAATIEAAERVHALPGDQLQTVQQQMIILRLLIDASDIASGVFEELTDAVTALGGPIDA